MIVITSLNDTPIFVIPGDKFHLTLSDAMGCEIIIREEITVKKEINFIASFRFALDDGTCPGFHLTGIFANKDELPIEIQNAIMFEDLTIDQQKRFVNSVGIDMKTRQAAKKDLPIANLLPIDDEFGNKLSLIMPKNPNFWKRTLTKVNDWSKK